MDKNTDPRYPYEPGDDSDNDVHVTPVFITADADTVQLSFGPCKMSEISALVLALNNPDLMHDLTDELLEYVERIMLARRAKLN